MRWPPGKRFAFTIVDDTDFSTVDNTRAVYELLADAGLRTTKTVWPLAAGEDALTGGQSIEDAAYREWVLGLQAKGFEIGLHGVSDGSSKRHRVAAGLSRFIDETGHDPRVYSNHVGQREAVYWGRRRFSGPLHWLYAGYRRYRRGTRPHDGVDPSSPYFWGDLCRSRIQFVRNMVFSDINTLRADPLMPYHDPSRPFVRYWFSSSCGPTPRDFCSLISEGNQDRLVEEGGACIVYTHFGGQFTPLAQRFKSLILRLAALPGWFVPASELLDYIGGQRGWPSVAENRVTFERMQWHWALDQCVRVGTETAIAKFEAMQRRWNGQTGGEQRLPRKAGSVAPPEVAVPARLIAAPIAQPK